MKQIFKIFYFLFFIAISVYGSTESIVPIVFTPQEKQWIQNNQAIIGTESWKPIIYYD